MLAPTVPAIHDFQGLARLRQDAQRHDPAALEETAVQFEALIVGMMLKASREASLGDGILDNAQSQQYLELMDQQVALELARQGGLGFGKMLVDGVRDTWAWSQEQQAVWAVAVIMALSDSDVTAEVIRAADCGDDWSVRYPSANGRADATLRGLRDATSVLVSRGVAEHWVSRLERTLALLPTYFTLSKASP